MTKLDRFQAAFDYLYRHGEFHSKKECADRLGKSRENVSGAYHGRAPFFNDKFILTFCREFTAINYKWIIGGEGKMLNEPEKPVQATEKQMQPGVENMLDIYAAIIRRIDDMKAELAKELQAVRTEREELRREREELRKERQIIYGTYIPAEPKYYATAEKETIHKPDKTANK